MRRRDKPTDTNGIERLDKRNGILYSPRPVVDTGQNMVVDVDKAIQLVDKVFLSTKKLKHGIRLWDCLYMNLSWVSRKIRPESPSYNGI